MLYTLNSHGVICQSYLNEEKISEWITEALNGLKMVQKNIPIHIYELSSLDMKWL